ncbi:MAG: ferritin [Armatimonadota bacterium]|nr:ferritin [Armatimonadota bacterium]MDR7436715.1 ferritin [Armatimonadota bacterium]MDR7471213.1 ferritin [Armatimonadota bacterium]MDR7583871.1 ferritin [Armatimonadota bacterium]
MLISPTMAKAIQDQIGREFGAFLQYVAIAAHFDGQSLPQLAAHFSRQAEEEREHAMRFIRYLIDAGAPVVIPAVAAPQAAFATAEEAVALSLRWEQEVTRQIHGILELALRENDYTTQQFLQWFVEEQLEEVSSMDKLLSVVRRAGEGGLLLVEDYLARAREDTGAKD